MNDEKISIVIPTYKRPNILLKTVNSLISIVQKYGFELIIVNDDKEANLELPPEIEVIAKIVNNPKKGVASARNYGADLSKNDWILFLDDDIIVKEESLSTIISLGMQDPYKIYYPNWKYTDEMIDKISDTPFGIHLENLGMTSLKGYLGVENRKNWKDNEVFEINSGASYCLLIKKTVFKQVSGYNETFPFAGFEDYDFPKRLKLIGVRFFVVPFATVLHNEEDRTDYNNWLNRKYRDALTRRIAYEIGYKELYPKHSSAKKFMYRTLMLGLPLYKGLLNFIYPYSFFKKLTIALFKVIEAGNFYKGFYIEGRKNLG